MPTTGTYAFTVAQADIVRHAMLNCGAIGEAEVPTSQEYTDVAFKLSMMIKQWMALKDFAPGLKIWTRQQGDLFLGFTKHQYQLGPGGDNWAAGVTGGVAGQTYNTTQLVNSVNSGATSIVVAPLPNNYQSATANVNIGDYIGLQYTAPNSGATDLFWTTASNVVGTTVTLANALTGPAAANAYIFNYTTQGQRPEAVLTCVLRDIYNNDIPMTVLNREDYDNLGTKEMPTFQSDPTMFLYEPKLGTGPGETYLCGQFFIDCYGAQDVSKHLKLTYYRPVQDLTNTADNPEYPHEWYRALVWGFTIDIAAMFDAVVTQDMVGNAASALAMAREANAETSSFYFQVYAGSPYDP